MPGLHFARRYQKWCDPTWRNSAESFARLTADTEDLNLIAPIHLSLGIRPMTTKSSVPPQPVLAKLGVSTLCSSRATCKNIWSTSARMDSGVACPFRCTASLLPHHRLYGSSIHAVLFAEQSGDLCRGHKTGHIKTHDSNVQAGSE
jgi:hypothetical protein